MSNFNWDNLPEHHEFSWDQAEQNAPPQATGLSGIAQDVGSSLKSLPGFLGNLVTSLPGEAYASGQQALSNPFRAASNVAGGAMKGIRGLVNVPSNVNDYLREKELSPFGQIPKVVPTGLENMLLEGNEPGDALLRGAGEFGTGGGLIGRGAKGLSGMAARAGGAGLTAVGSGEMDPIHAAVTSLIGDKAGEFSKKGLNKITDKNSKILKGIEEADVKDTVEAAQRLGLPYVTPAESSGFGYVGHQEGKIGNTLEGSKLREKRAKERGQAEENVIQGFLNDLDDEVELPKEKKALYDSIMGQQLPAEFLGPYILENPVVQSALKQIEGKAAYQQRFKNIDPNSFQYWDEVKRVLYDMESAEKRKGKNNLASSITDVRRDLIQRMDEIDPNYEKARKLGQRTILRREIESGFDKREMTGRNFYKTVIQSNKNFEKLFNDLSEFPEMQQKLLDMKTVFPKLIGTADAKAGVHFQRSGVGTPRSDIAFLGRLLKQHFNEKGDVKAVKAITSDWYKNLQNNSISAKGGNKSGMAERFVQDLLKSQAMGRQYEE